MQRWHPAFISTRGEKECLGARSWHLCIVYAALAAASFSLLGTLPQSAIAAQPSFDCVKASAWSEIEVCRDDGLAGLDANTCFPLSDAKSTARPEATERPRHRSATMAGGTRQLQVCTVRLALPDGDLQEKDRRTFVQSGARRRIDQLDGWRAARATVGGYG